MRSFVPYSVEEMEWLEANRLLVLSDYHSGFCAAFGRSDVSKDNLRSLRQRKGWKTGRRMQKGMPAPWRKGKKLNIQANPSWFKPGRPAHNKNAPGHEAIDDGYVRMVVDQPHPVTGVANHRVYKHRWRWEEENGPIPAGHLLKCRDGNRQNTDPSNWFLVPAGVLSRMVGGRGVRDFDRAPEELRPTIVALATLDYTIAKRRKA